jgi:hypothetical protein
MVEVQTWDPWKLVPCNNNLGNPLMCFHPVFMQCLIVFKMELIIYLKQQHVVQDHNLGNVSKLKNWNTKKIKIQSLL